MKIINLIDYVGVGLQSAMTYTYIGSRTKLFESDMTKSFLNKLNLKPYSDSMCSRKIGYSRHHTEDEATWEHEEEIREDYPELFPCAS
jgi:hypothetical protein